MKLTDTHTPPDFDVRVLTALKGKVNHENQRLFQGWRRTEGGSAEWNPLNSTLFVRGVTSNTNYNDIPVRNYRYEIGGVAATILTFIQRDNAGKMLYGGIVSDLQAGVKSAEQIVKDRQAQFKMWGTDTTLLLEVLSEIP